MFGQFGVSESRGASGNLGLRGLFSGVRSFLILLPCTAFHLEKLCTQSRQDIATWVGARVTEEVTPATELLVAQKAAAKVG